MVPLSSDLENREKYFDEWNQYLGSYSFTLGGNWDYDHGYFDHYLDEEHKVWLRIPFRVTGGEFDGEEIGSNARLTLDQPFVLKHLYQDGLDPEARVRISGSLIDQFQEPIDKDAEIETKWVEKANHVLRQIEQGLQQ